MRIYYDFFRQDFLSLIFYQDEKGVLIGIEYGKEGHPFDTENHQFLRRDNPFKKVKLHTETELMKKDLVGIKKQFMEYLNGRRKVFTFPVMVKGTDFQMKVWNYLLSLPYGEVVSYGEIAIAIGHPNAQRAVGSSVGANPLSIVIPCHRVINKHYRRSNGRGGNKFEGYSVGKYNGGEEIKRKLLLLEKVPLLSD